MHITYIDFVAVDSYRYFCPVVVFKVQVRIV